MADGILLSYRYDSKYFISGQNHVLDLFQILALH